MHIIIIIASDNDAIGIFDCSEVKRAVGLERLEMAEFFYDIIQIVDVGDIYVVRFEIGHWFLNRLFLLLGLVDCLFYFLWLLGFRVGIFLFGLSSLLALIFLWRWLLQGALKQM